MPVFTTEQEEFLRELFTSEGIKLLDLIHDVMRECVVFTTDRNCSPTTTASQGRVRQASVAIRRASRKELVRKGESPPISVFPSTKAKRFAI